MSKSISFRDLKLIPELSKYNEIELLHPDMDDLVNSFLAQLGFDTDYGILYVPAKHRDLQGKVAVGFRAVGEISINRHHINSPYSDITDRLVAASYEDPSRAEELAHMMGHSLNYKSLSGDTLVEEEDGEFLESDIEPDMDFIQTQIKQLEEIRDTLRGDYRNESGDIKTPAEYKRQAVQTPASTD